MWRLSCGLVLATLQLTSCLPEPEAEPPAAAIVPNPQSPFMAKVSPQARKNLGLVVRPVELTKFQQSIEVPGEVTDRPGVSDRGVVAPVTGVVTKIFAFPGETVAANQTLFTVRLASERLHESQFELFKATKEIELVKEQRKRLAGLTESGVLAQTRLIELDNRLQMLDVTVQAHRQDLFARGLPQPRIDAASQGDFITEIQVQAPTQEGSNQSGPSGFEIQKLRVSLGQQVEVGEVLCELGDHRRLLIEGHAFKSDLLMLHKALQNGAAIEATFEEQDAALWNEPPPPLRIEHVANSVDPASRVIRFMIPLTNQWREYRQEDRVGHLWRFRPGDRVRLKVPSGLRERVFVMPREGVVREGAEAYVFRQNGDLFERLPVTILEESRTQMAIANDGSIKRGAYLAQSNAASLQRIGKAQASSGQPANVHVHADGTVHAAH